MMRKFIVAALGVTALSGLVMADEASDRALLDKTIPEAKNFKLVYSFDPSKAQMTDGGKTIKYTIDKSKEITGKIKRIGYFLNLNKKDGSNQYVFVAMRPFTGEIGKIGVPDKTSGARFQVKVLDLFVKSNVKGVENGTFPEGGNIEFWDCNYAQANAMKIPEASDKTFDFGDTIVEKNSPGHGSMQVHNFEKKQTVFAFNAFRSGGNADLGIGNAPAGQPDWTFSKGANQCKDALMMVLVETE